jgi:hypothetical protein
MLSLMMMLLLRRICSADAHMLEHRTAQHVLQQILIDRYIDT